MTAAVFMYRTDSGCKTILAAEGRKYIRFVSMDAPISVTKVPMAEQRHMTPLDYQPKKAARRFRGAGKRLGITKGAKQFLDKEVAQ